MPEPDREALVERMVEAWFATKAHRLSFNERMSAALAVVEAARQERFDVRSDAQSREVLVEIITDREATNEAIVDTLLDMFAEGWGLTSEPVAVVEAERRERSRLHRNGCAVFLDPPEPCDCWPIVEAEQGDAATFRLSEARSAVLAAVAIGGRSANLVPVLDAYGKAMFTAGRGEREAQGAHGE